jgi:Holliday junction DNA helicase RuvA
MASLRRDAPMCLAIGLAWGWGVGPRTALGVLSGMSVEELVRAVSMQEAGRLTKVPGIGKKTAERLVIDLKDKLEKWESSVRLEEGLSQSNTRDSGESASLQEAIAALQTLGYREAEVRAVLKKCQLNKVGKVESELEASIEIETTESIIRQVLKYMVS